jgi:hypothetical protein
MLNRKKYVGILQPECRRYNYTIIDLVRYVFVSVPRVRVLRVSTNKVLPCAIAL